MTEYTKKKVVVNQSATLADMRF